MRRSVAAVGNVGSLATWSGIPWHFWQAAQKADFASLPWQVDLQKVTWQRYAWNLAGIMRGNSGGFQYSDWFLRLLEKQIPEECWASDIITFNQHFPRAASVRLRGGMLNHYLDAPFAALVSGRGLDLRFSKRVVEKALKDERENYQASQRVITMGRWAAEVIHHECGVSSHKLHTVLPGANLILPEKWSFPAFREGAGKSREFVLGFVGKDWARKGLLWLLELRETLVRRGWRVSVHVAGNMPSELSQRVGLHYTGFIDKSREPERFLDFLTACDLGCLFSTQEALGISTLEFLRAGVPVAGFAHEGIADTLPPDAGFRFEKGTGTEDAADRLESYLQNEAQQIEFHQNAQQWSPRVTWERCVREFQELWSNGLVAFPVRPWLGLDGRFRDAGT